MSASSDTVVVVGGGIIGLASALQLLKRGCDVTVIDPGTLSQRASTATAGLIGGSAVIPWASEGLWAQLPRMLIDRSSALQMSWPLPRGLLRYFAMCYRAGKPPALEQSSAGLAALGLSGYKHWMELLDAFPSARDLFRQTGCSFLYTTDTARIADERNNQLRESHGMQLQRLGSEQTTQRIPGLNIKPSGSVNVVEAGHVSDPVDLQKQMKMAIVELGGHIMPSKVSGFVIKGGRVTGVRTGNKEYSGDQFVIAAGFGSADLAAGLNCRIPLLAGFGSGLVLEQSNVKLDTPYLVLNEGFAVVPNYSNGENCLRVAGLVAIGASKPQLQCKLLLQKLSRLYGDLQYKSISSSSGARPLTPDSLPVISRAPDNDNVIFNFGHGHWGLTHAASSASLVADIMLRKESTIDINLFNANRFH